MEPIPLIRAKKILEALCTFAGSHAKESHPSQCGVWFDADTVMACDKVSLAAVWLAAPEYGSYDARMVSVSEVRKAIKYLRGGASDLCLTFERTSRGVLFHVVSKLDPYVKLATHPCSWVELEEHECAPETAQRDRWRKLVSPRYDVKDSLEGCSTTCFDMACLQRVAELGAALEANSIVRLGTEPLTPIQFDYQGKPYLPDGILRAVAVMAAVRF